MMKRILYGLVALVLMGSAAHAGWNLKQNQDGSAVWRDDRNGATVPVGGTFTLTLTDVTLPGTHYVVSHAQGYLRKAYITLQDSLTAGSTNTVTIMIGDNIGKQETSAGIMFRQASSGSSSAGGPSQMALGQTRTAGWTTSVSFPNNIRSRSNWVTQGSVIAITSDGASGGSGGTSQVQGIVTIVIE